MVVRDVPLSVQQSGYFQENSRLRVQLLNSTNKLVTSWGDMLNRYDVVVATAQVVLNNLNEGEAKLDQIDLLVYIFLVCSLCNFVLDSRRSP